MYYWLFSPMRTNRFERSSKTASVSLVNYPIELKTCGPSCYTLSRKYDVSSSPNCLSVSEFEWLMLFLIKKFKLGIHASNMKENL
jgi:hypothetical protein